MFPNIPLSISGGAEKLLSNKFFLFLVPNLAVGVGVYGKGEGFSWEGKMTA